MDERKTETIIFFAVAALIVGLVWFNLNNGMVQQGSLAGMATKYDQYPGESGVIVSGCGYYYYPAPQCLGSCPSGKTCMAYESDKTRSCSCVKGSGR